MTVVTVGIIVLAAVVSASVIVLYRRGNTGSRRHDRSAAELDAAARSASARVQDRQGYGPF